MAKGNDGERFHFVYRTTNKVNGKYYIGVHSTWKLDDGYLGSGKRLGYSIKKYGRENFELEIIQFFESHKEALAKERELVTEQLLKDPMCMNLKVGGEGGGNWTIEQQQELGKRASKRLKELYDLEPWRREQSRQSMQKARSLGKLSGFKHFLGRKHRPEVIAKMSASHKGMALGSKNGRFGSIWIRNEEEQRCISIRKEELDSYLSRGWIRGRKFKWKVIPNGDGA